MKKNNSGRDDEERLPSNIICFFCHAHLDPTNKTQHTLDDCLTNAFGMDEEDIDEDEWSRNFNHIAAEKVWQKPQKKDLSTRIADIVNFTPPPITKAPKLPGKGKGTHQ